MSRNCNLDTQTGKLFIIIRKDKEIPLDLITSYCQTFGNEYAFIKHEGDIDNESGEIEKVHYHIVLNAKDKTARLSTHLNRLVNFFNFDNAFGIEIEKYDNYVLAMQYLTHQNYKDKTQHDKSEIIHNLDQGEFDSIMVMDSDADITYEYLIRIIDNEDNLRGIIKCIGIKTYTRYRNTILDLWKEKY